MIVGHIAGIPIEESVLPFVSAGMAAPVLLALLQARIRRVGRALYAPINRSQPTKGEIE
jgi:hypothetical protein